MLSGRHRISEASAAYSSLAGERVSCPCPLPLPTQSPRHQPQFTVRGYAASQLRLDRFLGLQSSLSAGLACQQDFSRQPTVGRMQRLSYQTLACSSFAQHQVAPPAWSLRLPRASRAPLRVPQASASAELALERLGVEQRYYREERPSASLHRNSPVCTLVAVSSSVKGAGGLRVPANCCRRPPTSMSCCGWCPLQTQCKSRLRTEHFSGLRTPDIAGEQAAGLSALLNSAASTLGNPASRC